MEANKTNFFGGWKSDFSSASFLDPGCHINLSNGKKWNKSWPCGTHCVFYSLNCQVNIFIKLNRSVYITNVHTDFEKKKISMKNMIKGAKSVKQKSSYSSYCNSYSLLDLLNMYKSFKV